MAKIGLKRSDYSPGVFHLITAAMVTIIVIHVDDCIPVTEGKMRICELKDQLQQRFEIVDLGKIRWLLGFKIRRDRNACTISLSQRAYIDTILTHFCLAHLHPLTVPTDLHANLFAYELNENERSIMHSKPYAQLVSSLMYAAVGMWPDIAYAISTLARFMSDPATLHWEVAKRAL